MTDKPDTMPAWVRAVDEAMVSHHLGVADESDDYETATRKLNDLLCHAQSIGEYFARQHAEERCAALAEAAQAALEALAGYRREMALITNRAFAAQPCDAETAIQTALAAHKEKQ